jgi:3-phenylpropionate/trans-cinnamate dioxygenase ferredoxin component
VAPNYPETRTQRISVARVADQLHGFDDACSHDAYPLSAGLLTGATIMCR